MVVVIGLEMIMAGVRNGSTSTLAADLAHSSVNGSLGVLVVAFPGSLVETTNWWGLGILAAAVVARLKRGRLGEVSMLTEDGATVCCFIAHGQGTSPQWCQVAPISVGDYGTGQGSSVPTAWTSGSKYCQLADIETFYTNNRPMAIG